VGKDVLDLMGESYGSVSAPMQLEREFCPRVAFAHATFENSHLLPVTNVWRFASAFLDERNASPTKRRSFFSANHAVKVFIQIANKREHSMMTKSTLSYSLDLVNISTLRSVYFQD
jgi:hypothetical protein